MVAPKYVKQLEEKISELGIGKIITIGGRYYTMNRDRNWDLTEMGYQSIINGCGVYEASSIKEAFELEYSENQTDEFMKPTVLEKIPVADGDSMIMFNFRSDRMIQMLRALKDPDFDNFETRKINLCLVTMTDYESNPKYKDLLVAYKPVELKNTLGEYLSKKGFSQLRLSEYEKSGHITFYFSGCSNQIFLEEDRKIFDRADVFTYDEDPKMRSYDIADYFINSCLKYDFIVMNFPNGDALGHTGIYPKVIEGIEELDKCIGKIIKETNLDEYTLIITADHGNCENMIDPDGTPNKMHSTSRVPFIVVDKHYNIDSNYVGKLADVAPTILKIMNIDIPEEMTGDILIK